MASYINVGPVAQVDDPTEKQHEDNTIKTQSSSMSIRHLTIPSPSPHLHSVLVENSEDPSGKLLPTCLDEAKKDDEQMTKNWTEDTGGVLVFVSSRFSFNICPHV